MDPSNYSCDQAGCSQVARVFGLSPQCTKVKACGDHVLTLFDKHLSVHDISGYNFILSAEDGALYQQRKEMVRKGTGNLSTLESRSNTELERARSRIQSRKVSSLAVVERSYKEIELAVCQWHEEFQHKLQQSRSSFETFLASKDAQLSLEEAALCTEVGSVPCVRLVLGDCALAVAEAVLASFHLLPFEEQKVVAFARAQAEKGRVDLAKEACDCACSLGIANPCPDIHSVSQTYARKAARKLLRLLPKTATDLELQAAVRAEVASSLQEAETCNYAQVLRKFQQCEDLFQSRRLENPRLNLHLGSALAHFGKWSDADLMLRRGLDLQLTLDPASELAIQLSNGLAEAYYQTGQWQETVAMCEYALRNWSTTAHSYELLRTVYFLSSSYYYLEQHTKGYALVEEWRVAGASTPLCQCMWLFLQAEKLRLQKSQEAPGLYEEAVTQGTQQLPGSFMTAYSLRGLGRIYESKGQMQRAEQLYQQAIQSFATHYPQCFSYAQCLENCAYLYQNLVGSQTQAEECYLKAYEVLKDHFRKDRAFAYCLLNLGLLWAHTERKEEAIQKLETAKDLYLQAGDEANVGLCESALHGLRG